MKFYFHHNVLKVNTVNQSNYIFNTKKISLEFRTEKKCVKFEFDMGALINIPNRHIHTTPVSGNL